MTDLSGKGSVENTELFWYDVGLVALFSEAGSSVPNMLLPPPPGGLKTLKNTLSIITDNA